jgi:hypothetical protein
VIVCWEFLQNLPPSPHIIHEFSDPATPPPRGENLRLEPLLSHQPLRNESAMDELKIHQPPPSAHKDCKRCEDHYLTEISQRTGGAGDGDTLAVDDEMAQSMLSQVIEKTRNLLHLVKFTLLLNGDTILSRWKDYNKETRSKMLVEASSQLFQPPCLDGIEPDGRLTWEVDLAALSEDHMKLLSLLHVRSEYNPDQWTSFDTRSTHGVCRQSGWDVYIYNAKAVTMHGEQYGTLVEFDPDLAHSWQQLGFPRALTVIFTQHELALMLYTIVCLIAFDAEPSGASEWEEMISGGLRSAEEDALWSPYYHQEFAPPAKFDAGLILEKSQNQLNTLVDEIKLMQTNPEHMRQCALEIKRSTSFYQVVGNKAAQEWTDVSLAIHCPLFNDLTR